jgi:peptide/nickel transport system ATP-binding protein
VNESRNPQATDNGVRESVLKVRNLRVYYHLSAGPVKAANDVSFDLKRSERFGLVGESGSGKSTIALAILRMIRPPGQIQGGEVLLGGRDILTLSDEEMRRVRLAEIALVTQGAMNSLNPVLRIRDQIRDGLDDHGAGLSPRDFEKRLHDLLESVGLRPSVANMYPHELSGGMKQRACIAIAISLNPKVIIADEPTSALDVVVQRQIMETLEAVQDRLDASIILIGHDMGLMAQVVGRIGVMYGGALVEVSDVEAMFREPLHPYSQLLIGSLPSLRKKKALRGIPGLPPSLLNRPSNCLFHARCPFAFDRCKVEEPTLREVKPERFVACHLY